MGINVALEDEKGRNIRFIEDTVGLGRVLTEADDTHIIMAKTIDMYGNTIFNRRQAELLRNEWSLLIKDAVDLKIKAFLCEVDMILEECASGVHLYVKFYGD